MNLDPHDEDTGGLLKALLCVIALVFMVAIIAWLGKHMNP